MNESPCMSRYAVAVGAVLLLALAGCGSAAPTPAETAYLADVQRLGASITVDDPAGAVKDGHAICDEIAKAKPAERGGLAYFMQTQTAMDSTHVIAAKLSLCPELFV